MVLQTFQMIAHFSTFDINQSICYTFYLSKSMENKILKQSQNDKFEYRQKFIIIVAIIINESLIPGRNS